MASVLNPENKKFPEEFIIDLRSMMTKDAALGWQASDTKWVVDELYEEFRPSLMGIRHKSNRESSSMYEMLYARIELGSVTKITEAKVVESAQELVRERQNYLRRKRNAL